LAKRSLFVLKKQTSRSMSLPHGKKMKLLQGVLFMSMKFSAADAPAALGKMVSGAKGGAKESNVPISGEHQKVIDGVLFDVHSVTMPGNFSVNMRMAVVGERGYSIQGFSSAGDAAADPELLAVLESFRLLTKPTSPPPGDSSSDGEAFEFGQVVGKWAVIALFAGAVILTLLKASKGSKRSA
jgi:hypothetical protein